MWAFGSAILTFIGYKLTDKKVYIEEMKNNLID